MPESNTIGAALITRDALTSLKPLLAQLAELDQVVVVDTGSRDGTREYVRKLGPPFELHVFKWRPRPARYARDDWGFAAARNESFSHLKTAYALWLDSDDTVVSVIDGRHTPLSAAELSAGIRTLPSQAGDSDLWLADYVYTQDDFGNSTAVLTKERLLRMGAGWKWHYPVHEVLLSPRTKDLRASMISDLAVVHNQVDPAASIERNGPMLRAWLRQLDRDGNAPEAEVSRARFLVGRSLRAQKQFLKAARWMLTEFLAKHPGISPEDKWEGWMDVAMDLVQADDLGGARHALLEAIGLCPRFAEAYVMLAELKLRGGERPGDILKLIEVAQSCAGESYGPHEHNPMAVAFIAGLIGAQCQIRLGRFHEALLLAERAMSLRPSDPDARRAWETAAAGSSRQIATQTVIVPEPGDVQVRTPAPMRTPVFVVSTGRCGSTLVSNMLKLHPSILSLSELLIMLTPGAFPGARAPIYGTQFWALLSTPRKRMTFMYKHGIVFDEILYRPRPEQRFTVETGVPPLMLTTLPHLTDEPEVLYDEIEHWVLAQGAYPVGQHFIRLFDWLTERMGKKTWVERSGSSLAHLPDLIDNFPNARFIHLYRDGRECALSMHGHSAYRLSVIGGQLEAHIGVDPFNSDQAPAGEPPENLKNLMPDAFDRDAFWGYPVPLDTFGTSWSNMERHGISLLSQLPGERLYQLRYENLVAAPQSELGNILRFLGVADDDPEFLDRAAELVVRKPPAWRALPQAERDALDASCRAAMAMLYGPEVQGP
jgi:hypothetical protein